MCGYSGDKGDRGIRSDDGGQSWSFNYTGHDLNTMYRIARDEAHDVGYAAASSIHDMYLSTYLADAKIDRGKGRVLYTVDKGATWKTMRDMGHPVVWVALDPTRPNRLYADVVHGQEGGSSAPAIAGRRGIASPMRVFRR